MSQNPMPVVDFSYSFAPPHRMAVGLPDASERTLLDLTPGGLKLSWTTDDLTTFPVLAFKTPKVEWGLQLGFEVDGQEVTESSWRRVEGYFPALETNFTSAGCEAKLTCWGGKSACVTRIEAHNTDAKAHRLVIRVQSTAWGENPAWVRPGEWPGDALQCGWNERADKLIAFAVGADAYSLAESGKAPSPNSMVLVFDLDAGESKTGYLARPYEAYRKELPELRRRDWEVEIVEARAEWQRLLDSTTQFQAPDEGAHQAYKACLADCFIMREPIADGSIASVPGSEVYRAANTGEAAIVAIALDQHGLHEEAERGFRAPLAMQEEDGNWEDERGWGHFMWACSGFKAWALWEHYKLTGDKGYLCALFPRLLASARFHERERETTRLEPRGEHRATYGLLPRGFGDCGLKDDGDLYGVFLPHNYLAWYADQVALWAAQELGESAVELEQLVTRAKGDLLAAMEWGAIREADFAWLPGVPGKTSGSRWGALYALTPCRLLEGDDPLIEGTLAKFETPLSEGGLPVDTGWLEGGLWVAIALDNFAEAHLARDEGDAVASLFYATLNHATPLVTWCEERSPEPGATTCTGDRQHLWTPVAVVRCLRNLMIREDLSAQGLHIAQGMPRHWLGSGARVGAEKAATHFGPVTYSLQYDEATGTVEGTLEADWREAPDWVDFHLRLPEGLKIISVEPDASLELLSGERLRWSPDADKLHFSAKVGVS